MKSQINKKDIILCNRHTKQPITTLDKYEHDQKQQKLKNKHMWSENRSKFTFAIMESTKEVVQFLGHSQLAYLMLLTTYISYVDNVIRKTNKSPMDTCDMQKELGISKMTFYRFFNTCLKNNIINKNDDCSYSINSKYHFKGENKGDEKVVKVYNTEIRNAYNCMKPATLGLFYLLLPYIHLQTNTICLNPYEKDVTRLQKLNRKEVCELIGIDRSTFSSKILNAKIDCKPMIAKVEVLGKDSYLVNPWVFTRLKVEPNDNLVGEEIIPFEPDKSLRSIFSV
jgi:hypothetical protein